MYVVIFCTVDTGDTVNLIVTGEEPFSKLKTERWAALNELFNSPDRDLKNYPDKENIRELDPVNYKVIPRNWFDAMYDKTGVSGKKLTHH